MFIVLKSFIFTNRMLVLYFFLFYFILFHFLNDLTLVSFEGSNAMTETCISHATGGRKLLPG